MRYEYIVNGGKIDKLYLNALDCDDQTVAEGITTLKQLFETVPSAFYFSLDRYTKLNATALNEGRLDIENVLEPVNKFFGTLNKLECTAVAMTIINLHIAICNKFSEPALKMHDAEEFTYGLGDIIYELDDKIHLIDKIAEFVDAYVPLGNFDEIGTREQDTTELTFTKDHVRGLTIIAIMNKILCPVFSEYMNLLRNRKDIVCPHGYEMPCVFMLTKILRRYFPDLIDKFIAYIAHNINKRSAVIKGESAIMLQLSPLTLKDKTYAQLLLRAFVNIDLYHMVKNLMSVVCQSIIDTMNSTAKTVNESRVFIRKPPVKQRDEDTAGYLDISSSVSNASFDLSQMINASITPTMTAYRATYTVFTDAEWRSAIAFYKMNPIVPSTLSRFLNASFFGRALCGCQTTQLLKSCKFTECIVTLQMIAVKLGYFELANLLSARKSITFCPENTQFSSSYRGKNYDSVRAIFENGSIGLLAKSLDTYVTSMVNELATHTWYFNTCNELWEVTEHESMNGCEISLLNCIEEMCGMILFAREIDKNPCTVECHGTVKV